MFDDIGSVTDPQRSFNENGGIIYMYKRNIFTIINHKYSIRIRGICLHQILKSRGLCLTFSLRENCPG